MNNRTAKKIRKITGCGDKITRKVYRRTKKQYTKTPRHLKQNFLDALKDMLGSS